MLRRFSVNFAIFSMALDALSTLAAIHLSAFLRVRWSLPFQRPLDAVHLPLYIYLIAPVLWVLVFLLSSVYNPRRIYRVTEEFQRVALGTGFAALAFAGLLFFSFREVSRWWCALFLLTNFFLMLTWRAAVRLIWRLRRAPPARTRVLIIGAGEVGLRAGDAVRAHAWAGMELVGYLDDHPDGKDLPILGTLEQVREVVCRHGVDEVVIALPRRAYQRLDWLVETVLNLPIQVHIIPDYFALSLWRANWTEFAGMPIIDLRAPAIDDFQRLVKRVFDLVVGGIITLAVLPVMAIVALAIKLDSPGPVLFRQQRVGENGRLFTMYKFRSMVVGAEELQDQVNETDEKGRIIHKKRDDPRITRVGRFIRRFSLDELPQLFNVLKGDMSLVGPRPELPWLVEKYEPWQRKRFTVPQGITGWWQVNGRSDHPMHLSTEEDLYYIQNYSLWLDIYILLKTPWVVLRGKGAY